MHTIGVIGLGTMGKPMARNLMQAGYALNLLTRTRARAEDLIHAGGTWRGTPREVAETSEAVITMLPDSPDVEKVVAGPDGVLEGARPGLLLVDMSTISPVVARRLARAAEARGVDMLDAPVSGGERGAIEGTLSIMAGGTPEAFQRALPLLEVMGKTITHMGEAGAGQVTKAANQIVTAITVEAVAEALLFAARIGVDPTRVRQALLGGSAQSRILETAGQRILDRNYSPAGFRGVLHRKDLNIVLETAKAYGVSLPAAAAVRQVMDESIAAGNGELDTSAIALFLESLINREAPASKDGAQHDILSP